MSNQLILDIFGICIIIKIVMDMQKARKNKYSFTYTKYVDLVLMSAIVALIANSIEFISHSMGNPDRSVGTHTCNLILIVVLGLHWSEVFSRKR